MSEQNVELNDKAPWQADSTLTYNYIIYRRKTKKGTTEIDLTAAFREILINESIFSKIVNGSIVFSDRNRKFQQLLFDREDTILLSYYDTVGGISFTLEYSVVAMEFTQADNTEDIIVRVSFTETAYEALALEYSTSINKQIGSKFVQNFSEKVLKKKILDDDLETDSTKLTMAFPYMKFHYILEYLNAYLKSTKGNKNYYYYSDLYATRYVTLDSMWKSQPSATYTEVSPDQEHKHLNNFSSWSWNGSPDIQAVLLGRGLGSTTSYFNEKTKTLVTTKDEATSLKKIESNAIWTAPENANLSTKFYDAMTNYKGYIAMSDQMLMNGLSIKIEIRGLAVRRCGTVANIDLNDYVDLKNTNNENLSGKWLCTTIQHHLFPNKYYQTMVFSRNGFLTKYN